MAEYNFSIIQQLNDSAIGHNWHTTGIGSLTLASIALAFDRKLSRLQGTFNKDVYNENNAERVEKLSKISLDGDFSHLNEINDNVDWYKQSTSHWNVKLVKNDEIYNILTSDLSANDKIVSMYDIVVDAKVQSLSEKPMQKTLAVVKDSIGNRDFILDDSTRTYGSAVGDILFANSMINNKNDEISTSIKSYLKVDKVTELALNEYKFGCEELKREAIKKTIPYVNMTVDVIVDRGAVTRIEERQNEENTLAMVS